MKLRTKLIITFLTLILVPVSFAGAAFFGFGRYRINSIKDLYGVEAEALFLDMTLTIVLLLVFTSLLLTAWIYTVECEIWILDIFLSGYHIQFHACVLFFPTPTKCNHIFQILQHNGEGLSRTQTKFWIYWHLIIDDESMLIFSLEVC